MNRIERLLQELCPEGVEYRKLGELCEFQRGNTITAKDASDGDVPVVAGGQKPAYYRNVANREGKTIVIAGSGAYAGFVTYWEIPIFVSDAFSVNPNKNLDTKYLYYYLKNIQEKIHSTKKGSGVPHVHGSSIAKFDIPVPPLPIQEEIVRILDHFTELAAELRAELQARKEQYEYYRNKLLTFEEGDERVRWMKMSDIYDMKSGKSISASEISSMQTEEYPYPCYGGNGLRGYVATFNQEGEKVLVGRQGALCGNVCFVCNFFYATEHAIVISDKGYCLPHYTFYLLTMMDLNQYKTAGAQPGLSISRLEKIKIPIPSLSEQQRIVSILDKFETLVNDLSQGLPAEIAVVQEQYEYYRNKLLTFNRKA